MYVNTNLCTVYVRRYFTEHISSIAGNGSSMGQCFFQEPLRWSILLRLSVSQSYYMLKFPYFQAHSMLVRNVPIRLGINHLGFHIVNAEDNVSNLFHTVVLAKHLHLRCWIKLLALKEQTGVFLLKIKKSF